MKIFRELHRRRMWQILGIYLAASWLALQVVGTLGETIGVPEWFAPVAVGLLIIGLPIVLATAFIQGGGPRRGFVAAKPFADPASMPARDQGTGPPSVSTAAAPAAGSEAAAATDTAAAHHRLFTWRNAIAGGVLAFALLGVGGAGWMAMRTLGIGPAGTLVAKGVLDQKARVLVADFGSDTGDEALAAVASDGFRIELGQSEVVSVLEPGQVAGALERMGRQGSDGLDAETATEVAIREGIPVVVTGDLSAVGSRYVISARLVSPEDQAVLLSHKETAGSEDEIIETVDRLSKRLRERIGESLRTIQTAPPLEGVTTPSLEALRKFSQAVMIIDGGEDVTRGIALLEEAVEHDPEFAMAWRKLGMAYVVRGDQPARQVEAMTRAFELQDRLTDRERYLARAGYYGLVVNDPQQAIVAYEMMIEADPDDYYALNNVSIMYNQLREYERSVEYLRRAIRVAPNTFNSYAVLRAAQVAVGDFEGAWQTVDSMAARFPDNPRPLHNGFLLASAERDYGRATRLAESLRTEHGSNPEWRTRAEGFLAATAGVRGKLAAAAGHLREEERANVERGLPEQALFGAAIAALYHADVREDPEATARALDAALERYPLAEQEPLDRPYGAVITAYAAAGRPDRAMALLAEWESEIEPQFRDEVNTQRARAQIALAEGRYEEAAELFRRSDTGFCLLCSLDGLARTYVAAGPADSAIAILERRLERPWSFRVFFDQTRLGPAYERLGELYDERDDLENAAKYYAMFVELWVDADAELQPRVAAAQARLQEIVEARG